MVGDGGTLEEKRYFSLCGLAHSSCQTPTAPDFSSAGCLQARSTCHPTLTASGLASTWLLQWMRTARGTWCPAAFPEHPRLDLQWVVRMAFVCGWLPSPPEGRCLASSASTALQWLPCWPASRNCAQSSEVCIPALRVRDHASFGARLRLRCSERLSCLWFPNSSESLDFLLTSSPLT